MALIDLTIDSTTDYVAFRANSAEEMSSKLIEWFNDNSGLFIWDIELNGSGAAPNFLCTLTVGGSEGGGNSPILSVADAAIFVTGGIDTVDPIAMAAAMGAELRAEADDQDLYKAVSAGGGVGPHWMGIALWED